MDFEGRNGILDTINNIFTSPSYLKYVEVKKNKLKEEEWPDIFYIDEIVKVLDLPKDELILDFINKHLDIIKQRYKQSKYDTFNAFIVNNINRELLSENYLQVNPLLVLENAFEKIINHDNPKE